MLSPGIPVKNKPAFSEVNAAKQVMKSPDSTVEDIKIGGKSLKTTPKV